MARINGRRAPAPLSFCPHAWGHGACRWTTCPCLLPVPLHASNPSDMAVFVNPMMLSQYI
eukprot:366177-Chlamydomonas_euryale.AAC.7